MVNETGRQILNGLAEMRRLFGQISLLIQTADTVLAEEGWSCISGNRCTELTGHIRRPEKWAPRIIYSFYSLSKDSEPPDGKRNVILFLGVLLDQERAWGGFQEPWLTFGVDEFLPNIRYTYEDEVIAPLIDQRDPDGAFHTWDHEKDEGKAERLIYQSAAALPLVSVKSEEDIRRLVIDPLLNKAHARLGKGRDK
jgi:hypothetical protein